MNAQAILDKIGEDARAAAEGLVQEAGKKASQLMEASRAKMDAQRETMVIQAEKESAELEQRMLRMAELDDRKELLGKKQALMDEAFAVAREKLVSMPAKDMRAFFLKQVTDVANGSETLVLGADKAGWFDPSFVEEADKALAAKGKEGKLTVASEKRPGCTGVILAGQGSQVVCTFETVLDSLRADMEAQIARELFGG